MRVYASETRFEEYARRYGINLPSGEEIKRTFYESHFLVKSDQPLFRIILDNQQKYSDIAWVEVPEEEGT